MGILTHLDLKAIGKRIQIQRKKQNITQEKLADMMNVSIQMVSNLERGNKSIRIENLINLSDILKVSTDYILTGTESTKDIENITRKFSELSQRDKKMLENILNYMLEND